MEQEERHRKFESIPKKDIFSAPDGYFDSLERRIEDRLSKPASKTVRLFNPWTVAGLAAAAVLGIWIIFIPGARTPSTLSPNAETLLAEVTQQDCLAYLESTGLETEDILPIALEELAAEDLTTGADTLVPGLTEEEEELLYQRYGVTSDENLQKI